MSDEPVELAMSVNGSPEELFDSLIEMGFTPWTHPTLIKDMHRGFQEAAAHTDIDLDEPVSVRFLFDDHGLTEVKIERKNGS